MKNLTLFEPSCEVMETESDFQMNFDLPGVKKEDISISLQDQTLIVRGERKDECEQRGTNHYHNERYYGWMERKFNLPENAKAEEIKADYKDGVLHIAIPKTATSRYQRIPVKAA